MDTNKVLMTVYPGLLATCLLLLSATACSSDGSCENDGHCWIDERCQVGVCVADEGSPLRNEETPGGINSDPSDRNELTSCIDSSLDGEMDWKVPSSGTNDCGYNCITSIHVSFSKGILESMEGLPCVRKTTYKNRSGIDEPYPEPEPDKCEQFYTCGQCLFMFLHWSFDQGHWELRGAGPESDEYCARLTFMNYEIY